MLNMSDLQIAITEHETKINKTETPRRMLMVDSTCKSMPSSASTCISQEPNHA